MCANKIHYFCCCFFFSDKEITLKLSIAAQSRTESKRDVKIIISVGKDYPNRIPEFSVISEEIKREGIADLKTVVNASCKDLTGQPMLLSMVSIIQEELARNTVANNSLTPSEGDADDIVKPDSYSADDKWTTLLHIDHMRSQTKYCKTLEKWSKDLGLCGRLLFYRRLILLVLQGSLHKIKVCILPMSQWAHIVGTASSQHRYVLRSH